MKKEITLGNLLAILIPVFIIILAWGVSVEARVVEHSVRIDHNAKMQSTIISNQEKMKSTMTKILIELQNKEDKDK